MEMDNLNQSNNSPAILDTLTSNSTILGALISNNTNLNSLTKLLKDSVTSFSSIYADNHVYQNTAEVDVSGSDTSEMPTAD